MKSYVPKQDPLACKQRPKNSRPKNSSSTPKISSFVNKALRTPVTDTFRTYDRSNYQEETGPSSSREVIPTSGGPCAVVTVFLVGRKTIILASHGVFSKVVVEMTLIASLGSRWLL